MKLTIFTSDMGEITIKSFESESALDLVEQLNDPDANQFFTFEVDADTVIVNRGHIVRIDIEGA